MNGNHNVAGMTEKSGDGLATAASMWLTPNVPNGGRSVDAETVANKGQTETGKRTVGLESQVRHWPTPRTPSGGTETRSSKAKRGAGGECLQTAAAHWNTPKATADKHGRPISAARGDLQAQAISQSSHLDPDPETSGLRSSQLARTSRPRLNSTFVGWLMGFPPAWTDYGPSAMEFALWQQRMRSLLSSLVTANSDEPQLSLFG